MASTNSTGFIGNVFNSLREAATGLSSGSARVFNRTVGMGANIITDFGRGPIARHHIATGLQNMSHPITGRSMTKSGSMKMVREWTHTGQATSKQANKLQTLAYLSTNSKNTKIRTRALKKGTELLAEISRQKPQRAMGWFGRNVGNSNVAHGFGGKNLLTKSYSNALFNPRTIALAGLTIGGANSFKWAYNKAENMRTEATGSGRFGTDTRGQLGPASIEGLRFTSSSKRKLL